MQIKELKEICKLVNMGGLIDEFNILKDGHILGVDSAKTAVADLQYKIELPRNIYITNLKGLGEVLDKFTDDTNIEILEDRLHIESGKKSANIILKVSTESQFKIPELIEDNYEIIVESVDHNILNKLGKFRPSQLINELYYLYVLDNILMMRIGNESETNVGDEIGVIKKCTSNDTIKFTQNISECFKNISTTANINIYMGKLMMIECKTDKYAVKYYLAPRVE